MRGYVLGRLRCTVQLRAGRAQQDNCQQDGEVADKTPLQRAVGNMGGEQGADGAAGTEADREPDQRAGRNAMAAPTVIAQAGKAGRQHLRDERDALGDMLVLAEDQDQQGNQNAAAGDPQKARGQAADAAGQKSAEHVRKIHARLSRISAGADGAARSSLFASFHSASISSSDASSSERPRAASVRSM